MNMTTHRRCQLTIIAEYVLESRLVAVVAHHGAHGYTVHEVRGGSFSAEGERQRDGAGETLRTIEMKVICDRPVAEAISAQVIEDFGRNFSVRLMLSDVEVFRPGKY